MIIVILPVISLTRGIIFGKVASQTTIMNWLAIHEKFYKNWQLLAVFILAMIFFVVTSGFISLMNEDGLIKWLSPDENANYYFTKLYAEHDTLIAFDKDNKAVQEIIHPRSFRSDLGELKPVSFLGIILIYGSLAKLFGIQIIPYLTPMFASFGIIFYYLLIKQIFDKKIDLLSAVLLSFFPVYIYYTARSMFHNILFTVFFIIGLYFLVKIVSKKKIGDDKVYLKEFILNFFKYKKGDLHGLMMSALSGLFFGLAVLTRTSEMLWLLPA
ncbi:MAG: glycosyltransferase family 39 protein, partial [Candidatus Falkowbacteria bacterium]|nr:glycosyltransferase family 39 protein [Candidatus Falkowbacteria bacterium]